MVYNFNFLANSEQLAVDELCRLTGVSAVSIKRAILFLVLKGVLKEIAQDTFQVLEYAEEASPNQSTILLFRV